MDKMYLFPIGLAIVLIIFIVFIVSSVHTQTEYRNERFEQRNADGLARDQVNLNEIKSISECNNMFVSIMKHDNEWWEESNRQQAWNLYKERCL